MKKVLFATTALIATAGVASADIALSGSAQMGVIYTESVANATDWVVQDEVDLAVSMTGATDAFSFGADFNISGDADNTEDPTVFISGAFGKISVGEDVAEANRIGGIADIGYDGLGVDDVAEDNYEGTGANVNWTYSVDALTVGLSFLSDNNNAAPYAVGLTYKTGAVDVNVGYADEDNAAETNIVNFGIGYTAGAMTIDAMSTNRQANNAADIQTVGVSVAYAVDANQTLTFAVADSDAAANTGDTMGIGYSNNLGGGATFNAGVASVNDVSNASFGLNFSF